MATAHTLDLSYRPASYWEHADPASAVTHGIKGETRRRRARAALEAGEPLPDWVVRPLVDTPTLGRPALLGPRVLAGEHLPPNLPGETTIARVVFHTTTGHVIEVRARPEGDGLAYRVVDELETDYEVAITRTRAPLRLGQLVRVLERSRAPGRSSSGLILPTLEALVSDPPARLADWLDWVWAVCRLVSLDSAFYPGLELYGEELIEDWLDRRESRWLVPEPPGLSGEAELRFPGEAELRFPAEGGPDAGETPIDRLCRRWWGLRQHSPFSVGQCAVPSGWVSHGDQSSDLEGPFWEEEYFVSHDAGVDGPYESKETAMDDFEIEWPNSATVEIWDEERGTVYARDMDEPSVVSARTPSRACGACGACGAQLALDLPTATRTSGSAWRGRATRSALSGSWIEATRVNPGDPRALELAEGLVEEEPDLLFLVPGLQEELEECRRAVGLARERLRGG